MAVRKTTTQTAIAGGVFKGTYAQLDESAILVGSGVGYGVAVASTGVYGEVQVRDDGDQLGNGATTPADNKFFGIVALHNDGVDKNLAVDGYVATTLSAPTGQGQTEFAEENKPYTIIRKGMVGVKTETALAVDDVVYMRINTADDTTTENGKVLGGITGTDDADTELIPNAIVRVGADANGIAVIEIK